MFHWYCVRETEGFIFMIRNFFFLFSVHYFRYKKASSLSYTLVAYSRRWWTMPSTIATEVLFVHAPARNAIPILHCITTPQATQQNRTLLSLQALLGCLILLTSSLWDKTWSRSCHPRRSMDLGLGSSQHRQSHRCGSDARIPGWSLHLSSHTTVAVEGNGKIYFRCGAAPPETRLTHLQTFQLILELTQDQEGSH